jgi:hypothetical protein
MKQLFAYEAARIMFAHPFNRYVWAVEPPQHITAYSSVRSQYIGQFYTNLVRLISADMTNNDPGNDSDERLAILEKYLEFLGPAFVEKFFAEEIQRRRDPDVAPEDELIKAEDVSWARIAELVPYMEELMASLIEARCKPPLGEPERDHAHWGKMSEGYRLDHDIKLEDDDDEQEEPGPGKRRREGGSGQSRKRARHDEGDEEDVVDDEDAADPVEEAAGFEAGVSDAEDDIPVKDLDQNIDAVRLRFPRAMRRIWQRAKLRAEKLPIPPELAAKQAQDEEDGDCSEGVEYADMVNSLCNHPVPDTGDA